MDKKDKVLFNNSKTILSQKYGVMRKSTDKNTRGKVQPNKKKRSPLRKALNELDPRFDDMARMMWRTPPLRLKDLKAQLKKEQEEKKR